MGCICHVLRLTVKFGEHLQTTPDYVLPYAVLFIRRLFERYALQGIRGSLAAIVLYHFLHDPAKRLCCCFRVNFRHAKISHRRF